MAGATQDGVPNKTYNHTSNFKYFVCGRLVFYHFILVFFKGVVWICCRSVFLEVLLAILFHGGRGRDELFRCHFVDFLSDEFLFINRALDLR